ncbi:MAG: TIR domain-containing protein [Steroidobacteraceae bacterium]
MTEDSPNQSALGHDVFLSYASQDAAVANSIIENLEGQGLKCWIAPRDVKPGAKYADAIVRAINDAKSVVLVMSGSAVGSSHVAREIERAASKRKQIIPFRIDAAALNPELEYFLSNSQWIDVPKLGMPAAFARLREAVGQGSAPLSQAVPTLRSRGDWQRLTVATAVVIAVGIIVAEGVHFWTSKHTGAQPPAVGAITDKSIAVLPFVDMSEKHDQEYFADGMAEELIEALTKVTELHVPARTSSFYFKGKQTTIAEIANALGVANVLEGSVRKSGNTIRVTAQLVRVENGYHVWSETFDRQLDEIFKVQDEIAGAVVKALKVSLLEGQTARATPTMNTEAYTLYLQGRSFWQRHSAADNKKAADYLREALKLDPMFAAAWAVLAAVVQDDFVIYSTSSYQKARAEAYPAAERALVLDPSLSDAHLAMAQILHDLDFDFKRAGAEITKALTLDPGNSGAFRAATDLALTEGRFDEARQFAQQAVARDPLAVGNYRALGDANLCSGLLAEAEVAWRKALELNSAAEGIHYRLGAMLIARGEPAAALAEMEQNPDKEWRIAGLPLALDALGRKDEADHALAVAVEKLSEIGPYQIALIYAHRNDLNPAFLWLDRAYQERDGALPIYLKGDPLLKNVRQDPRYKGLLKKMNLPE